MRQVREWHWAGVVALSCWCLAGCTPRTQIATAKSDADRRAAAASQQDHVAAALQFLHEYDRYPQETVMGRVLHHLRRWTEDSQPDVDWLADPMYGRLPDRLQLDKNPAFLARRSFRAEDVDALRESLWLRDLAQRLAKDPRMEPELADWFDRHQSDWTDVQLHELRSVAAIFDWVVRNIQLEPTELDVPDDDSEQLPAPRPGVRRTAWEALLLGRGDALNRGRLVLLLARQLEIPVVMLARDDASETAPWGLGALVGNQLYVLDPKLGLPIPGPDGDGIATLSQIVADPGLLRQLDLDDEAYRVQASDVESLVALVDATPQSLSQRMRLLELALPSQDKAVLTTAPTALRQRLEGLDGIDRVALWTQPYDLYQFRRDWQQRYPTAFREWQREMVPLQAPWPLAFARRQHIRGIFSDPEDQEGARQLYLKERLSDAQIAQIRTAESLQLLLQRLLGAGSWVPDDPRILQEMLKATRDVLRVTRSYASYQLGQIASETGEYRVANDYFGKRILDEDPNSTWRAGCHYNMGRSYEALGNEQHDARAWKHAVEHYLADTESEQRFGNRLRAKRLGERITATETTSP